jgi:hypothetical protein
MHKTIITLLVAVVLLQGCGVLSYDHRGKLAMDAVYDVNGKLDEEAFSAALNNKSGLTNSPPSSLTSFVEQHGGKCVVDSPRTMFCRLPQSGTFCTMSVIMLSATIENGVVKRIRASTGLTGC